MLQRKSDRQPFPLDFDVAGLVLTHCVDPTWLSALAKSDDGQMVELTVAQSK